MEFTSQDAGIKIVVVLEYDGTRYHGSQIQSNGITIQGELEEALFKLTQVRTRVDSASRTDAGVHSLSQYFCFRTRANLTIEEYVKGLNYYLPEDIAVKGAAVVDSSFDARRNARSREYKYYIINSSTRSPIWRTKAHLVRSELDAEMMNQACKALIGRQDFSSFVTGDERGIKSTVRELRRAEIKRDGNLITFEVEANSFLPHQVRNMIGSLIRVGLKKISLEDFQNIIEAKTFGLAEPTAPACGLYLTKISYPKLFEGDKWGEI